MNRNYLEAIHEHAELPHVFNQRFFPTDEELEWALDRRAKNPGPLIVVAPFGSGEPKTWPHVQKFMEMMNEREVRCVVFGDHRLPLKDVEPYAIFAGTLLPIRHAMTLAQIADVVVGTETAILNSVAMTSNFKVALLMHSSAENLTKHWVNTVAIESTDVPCFPCHRLHNTMEHCVPDSKTGYAVCQSSITAEEVAALIDPVVDRARVSRLKAA